MDEDNKLNVSYGFSILVSLTLASFLFILINLHGNTAFSARYTSFLFVMVQPSSLKDGS